MKNSTTDLHNKDDDQIINKKSSTIQMKKLGVDNSENVKLEGINEDNEKNDETVKEDEENPEDTIFEAENLEEVEDNTDTIEVDGRRRKINNNTYVAKKTAAQGLMDIALLTANANQLRYIIEYTSSFTFVINITLILISIILQILVGITLVFQGRYYYRGESKKKRCKSLKNYIIICVFLITMVNVFIASFTQIVPRDQIVSVNRNNK